MAKKKFKAESKRLLDLMINSIYTHKEIFLRELISNASDAIDKLYYKALTDEAINFDSEDFFIKIIPNKDERTLRIIDTGIGMTKEELDDNLGVIAKSGSLQFKSEMEEKDEIEIIGQFGVGFYSAFMVAESVTVLTKPYGSEQGYKWYSKHADGYSITEIEKDTYGTEIILELKENTDDENYDEYLETYRLRNLIKRYSDFIRYPIKMDTERSELKEGTEDEYETIVEEETINSMVPIWRKNKSELSDEDYNNFYAEKHFGFDQPLAHIHIKAEGLVRYNAILYIPERAPFDFYSKDYEKGLELYTNGVMIMDKCSDLLPDAFSFVKGVVESDDLTLNISREVLQHNRQLKVIAKNIKNKIKSELVKIRNDERERYESFFDAFGRQLKYALYSSYGAEREDLEELLMFYSSSEDKLVSLEEYFDRMPEDQKEIYYASGESIEKIEKMPQTELIADKGYEILYFTDEVDEFTIRSLMQYKEKPFKSVSASDLDIESEDKEEEEAKAEESKDLLAKMKEHLGDKVKEVRLSKRLKNHPVCIVSEGEISVEMERVLSMMPDNQNISAEKVLEINPHHSVYEALKAASDDGDDEKVGLYADLLYDQARLMEGLSIDDPVAFSENICKLM